MAQTKLPASKCPSKAKCNMQMNFPPATQKWKQIKKIFSPVAASTDNDPRRISSSKYPEKRLCEAITGIV